MKRRLTVILASVFAAAAPPVATAQEEERGAATATGRGDALLAAYFAAETAKLEEACLSGIHAADDWLQARERYRRELLEMLALDPFPEKTPLNARVTGRVEVDGNGEGDAFAVEKVVFESMPRFYVTANLYLPRDTSKPVPAILYVCGHGPQKIDGVSYGNKVSYQHHGAWFARHGYACLTIDTVQMGEIEGTHHGTYREGMWWWNARGYSSAGAETWNCVRALDYLETRPEIDSGRIGVTGRSGGGAYSWWIAAIDERIKVAVPVAGITSLRNHVVDGCVEGHCDCMFPVNTYRWDFPMIPALVAPRPLLISNSDKDTIFPLDGVYAVHQQARRIYRLLGAGNNLGLQITEGPHKDTQVLRVHAFAWFERFLKGIDPPPLIDRPAVPFLTPQQLKVLDAIPADERTSRIEETFAVQAPAPEVPAGAGAWERMRDGWMQALRGKVFRGWPDNAGEIQVRQVSAGEADGVRLRAFTYESQPGVPLPMLVLSADRLVTGAVVTVLDEEGWRAFAAKARTVFAPQLEPLFAGGPEALPAADAEGYNRMADAVRNGGVRQIYLLPRGIGPTAWSTDARHRVHVRRRFMLLGQTLDGMRVWDIRRGLEAADVVTPDIASGSLHARGTMAVNTLYASLFAEGARWRNQLLTAVPASHHEGPDYLNVLRFLDIPQALAMASQRGAVIVQNEDPGVTGYAVQVREALAARGENP